LSSHSFSLPSRRPPISPLFPYTTLFRSSRRNFLGLSAGAGAAAALAACGSSGPGTSSGNGSTSATYWYLSGAPGEQVRTATVNRDRKSTRLNSSHLGISYAVFCLKKKKQ